MEPALLTRLFIIQGGMVAKTDGQMETSIAFLPTYPLSSNYFPSYITFAVSILSSVPRTIFAVTSQTHRAV